MSHKDNNQREKNIFGNSLSKGLTVIILIEIFLISLGTSSNSFIIPSSSHYQSPINMSVNQGSSIDLTLNISKINIERGNNFFILYGVTNKTNPTQYLSGYEFHLYTKKTSSNSSITLLNGTSSNFLGNFTVETYFSEKPLTVGNYSLFLDVNTTKGIVSKNTTYSIFASPQANVIFRFFPGSNLNVNLNQLVNVSLIIENIGESNAFNVSSIVQSLNEPIGINETIFPVNMAILTPNKRIQLNFTIKPTRVGLGALDLLTSYSTINNVKTLKTIQLFITVKPKLVVEFNPKDQLLFSNTTTVSVQIRNLENFSVIISISLTSDLINFNQPIETKAHELPALYTQNIEFIGNVLKTGAASLTLTVIFYDQDGSGSIPIFIITRIVLIQSNQIPPSLLTDYLLLVVQLLGYISLAILILGSVWLYFDKENRYKLISRVIPKNPADRLKLPGNSIIVDGSNVAWEIPEKGRANLNNLDLAIKTLKNKGFKDIVIVVDAALRYQVQNKDQFDKLVKEGKLKVMPAKVNGDQFILRLSDERNAFILSNDLFKEFREEFTNIDDKRVPYTILDGILYLHPLATDHKSE